MPIKNVNQLTYQIQNDPAEASTPVMKRSSKQTPDINDSCDVFIMKKMLNRFEKNRTPDSQIKVIAPSPQILIKKPQTAHTRRPKSFLLNKGSI